MSQVDDKENIPASSPSEKAAFTPPSTRASLVSGMVSFPSTDKDGNGGGASESNSASPESPASAGKPTKLPIIYPASARAKSNKMPFSRSAAKRESVMALGSIGYLQNFYAKQGIASRNRPLTKGALTLAIGPAGESMLSNGTSSPPLSPTELSAAASGSKRSTNGSYQLIASPDLQELELPPCPQPPASTRPPYPIVPKPVEADPEALWPLLLRDLDLTCQLWGLLDHLKTEDLQSGVRRLSLQLQSPAPSFSPDADHEPQAKVDLVKLLDSTAKTVRSVRNYFVALPPDSLNGMRINLTPGEPKAKDKFRRQSSFSNISRPGSVSPIPSEKKYGSLNRRAAPSEQLRAAPSTGNESRSLSAAHAASPNSTYLASPLSAPVDEDPLTVIRKSALEVLGTLREVEERCRLPPDHPDYVNAEEEATGSLGISVTSSPPRTRGGLAGLFNPSTTDLSLDGSPAKLEAEDGFLYRADLTLSDLQKERSIVSTYLSTVDKVMSVVKRPKAASKRRSIDVEPSNGAHPLIHVEAPDALGPIPVEDAVASHGNEELPAWASPAEHPDGELGRIRDFLLAHLDPGLGLELIQAATEVSEQDEGGKTLDLSETGLLGRLSDGEMLCLAYNAALRQSARPWGFIPAREIHNLKEEAAKALEKQRERAKRMEEDEQEPFQTKHGRARREGSQAESTNGELESRPGWTFRRAENLRVWAAALKLRYQITTTTTVSKPASEKGKLRLHPRRVFSEASGSGSRTGKTSRAGDDAVEFDARVVATKEDGWSDMLFVLLSRWVKAVAAEERDRGEMQ